MIEYTLHIEVTYLERTSSITLTRVENSLVNNGVNLLIWSTTGLSSKVNNNSRIGDSMKEILHHLLGSCGEGHISIMTIISSSVAYLYKDYIVGAIKELKDVYFK